jgi:DNA sulfur modification protein DndC
VANKVSDRNKSAFEEIGIKQTVAELVEQTKLLYLSDDIPWVVGYSGGKDSTASLQIVWMALESLRPEQRKKPVHVISTDTLVENPVVASWVENSLHTMGKAARVQNIPVEPHRLTPAIEDTFWVNLIGRGYPAPRFKFRWCTERMKINPSNTFITDMVRRNGETILVLGTRKAESAGRSARMKLLETKRIRENLSPSTTLANCFIYSPIADWSNDDVWMFLMQFKNSWGYNNKDLLTMYQGASPDGECPLVVDSTTPSCGDSRFGCWVCTLVEKDKSMNAMVQNDEEKNWMRPLMLFREMIDPKVEREDKVRDFRRITGRVQAHYEGSVPGPYTQQHRVKLLKELLKAQQWIRKNGPDHVRNFEIITKGELHEIRRIWVMDKHELEDFVPKIYEEVIEEAFDGVKLDESLTFGDTELEILNGLTKDDRLHYEMVRELLHVEHGFRNKSKRAGLFDALEGVFKKHFYEDEADAVQHAQRKKKALDEARRAGSSEEAKA